MNFEELQKAWQDHNHEKGSLDPDLLLNEVRRNNARGLYDAAIAHAREAAARVKNHRRLTEATRDGR